MLRLAFLTVALLAALPAHADTVTIFAAASLRTALDRLAPEIEAETGHTVRVSYAGSSALARQIQQGAPAGIFVSANAAWMDVLEKDGVLAPGTRADLLTNALVLIGADGAEPIDPADLPQALDETIHGGRLATSLVDAVPAGIYARQALVSTGLWETLRPRLAQTDNVRTALALVATGEAPYGIVYATDAEAEPRVSVVARFGPDSHDPIRYPAALIAPATDPARTVLEALRSPTARTVFADEGFGVAG